MRYLVFTRKFPADRKNVICVELTPSYQYRMGIIILIGGSFSKNHI